MRKRLTVAFVLLTVTLCLSWFVAHTYSVESTMRKDESEEIHQAAVAIGTAVRARLLNQETVDRTFLADLTGADRRIKLTLRDPDTSIVVAGPEFTGAADPSRSDDLWATYELPGGYLIVSQSGDMLGTLVLNRPWQVVLSFSLLALAAGLVGYLLAGTLAKPFRQLAAAAAALGRGRFDLDLPDSRVPEVQAISSALRRSAGQLQERIGTEQAFAEHASHVLRTPLTSLRLELDDLSAHGGLPPDVCAAIGRCVQRIESLDAVAGELIALSKGTALVEGAEVSLRELATTLAQRWADELAHHDRTLTAAVEGDLDVAYTPGPVEHIHELLLVDVLHRSRGAVRITYEATPEGALKVHIAAAEPARTRNKTAGSPFQRAHAVVAALGGRLEGEYAERGLDIVLPHR